MVCCTVDQYDILYNAHYEQAMCDCIYNNYYTCLLPDLIISTPSIDKYYLKEKLILYISPDEIMSLLLFCCSVKLALLNRVRACVPAYVHVCVFLCV